MRTLHDAHLVQHSEAEGELREREGKVVQREETLKTREAAVAKWKTALDAKFVVYEKNVKEFDGRKSAWAVSARDAKLENVRKTMHAENELLKKLWERQREEERRKLEEEFVSLEAILRQQLDMERVAHKDVQTTIRELKKELAKAIAEQEAKSAAQLESDRKTIQAEKEDLKKAWEREREDERKNLEEEFKKKEASLREQLVKEKAEFEHKTKAENVEFEQECENAQKFAKELADLEVKKVDLEAKRANTKTQTWRNKRSQSKLLAEQAKHRKAEGELAKREDKVEQREEAVKAREAAVAKWKTTLDAEFAVKTADHEKNGKQFDSMESARAVSAKEELAKAELRESFEKEQQHLTNKYQEALEELERKLKLQSERLSKREGKVEELEEILKAREGAVAEKEASWRATLDAEFAVKTADHEKNVKQFDSVESARAVSAKEELGKRKAELSFEKKQQHLEKKYQQALEEIDLGPATVVRYLVQHCAN